ncbi:MAG TPA: Rossmann-like and DUF2520 domain-containing protein, partial [Haliangium sp.]|nr:Rossmann-like and DUF2520 domain-containing protein [Haliangium sp.]
AVSMTAPVPSVFVMGAGRVATALAGGLARAGVRVLGLWARDPTAAQAAARVAGVPGSGPELPDAVRAAGSVILAVRDQAIAEVADRLVAAGLAGAEHVLLHCSGARSAAEALGPASARVAGAGTMHPLRSIADGRSGMAALAGTMFGIEGDARGQAAARALVTALGGTPLVLAAEHMTRYHTAATMAANYVVTLIDAAVALLGRAGIARADAVAALVPLVQGSVANVAARGTSEALTGPIRRGDRVTVERHLAALADTPDLDALYRVLGRRTVDLARRTQAVADAELDALAALLDHALPPSGTCEHERAPPAPGKTDGRE